MKTNHIQIGSAIYCHRTGGITRYTGHHFNLYCTGCPFFNGTAQGEGIECEFDSGYKEQILFLDGGMPDAQALRANAEKFFKRDPNLPKDPELEETPEEDEEDEAE